MKKIFIQFKNKNLEFVGRLYDYLLHEDEEIPTPNTIVRLLDEDYNYLNYGTRVKVVDVVDAMLEDMDTKKIVRYLTDSI